MSREITSQYSRDFLLKKKGTMCANCQMKFRQCEIEFHHVVPIAVGGYDVFTNILPLCSDCHSLVHRGKEKGCFTSDLIKAGLQKRKEDGDSIGRPRVTYNNLDDIVKMYCEQINKKEITIMNAARKLLISRPTMYKYLKLYNDYQEKKSAQDLISITTNL